MGDDGRPFASNQRIYCEVDRLDMRYLVWEELETTGEKLEGTTGDYPSNWVMNVNVVGQRTCSVDSPQDGDWAIPRES